MHLVYDIYFIFCRRSRINNIVTQITYIINTVVRGGVHFYNVENAAVQYTPAYLTFVAGIAVFTVYTVDCP